MRRRIGLAGSLAIVGLALMVTAASAAVPGKVGVKTIDNELYGSLSKLDVLLSVAITKAAGLSTADSFTIKGKIVWIDDYGDGSQGTLDTFETVNGAIPASSAKWQSDTYEYRFEHRDYKGNPYTKSDYFHRIFLKIKFWDGATLLKTVSVKSYGSI